MPRYHLTIEFDGTNYVGWQRQDNGPSIQGDIEAAGRKLAGAPTPVYGAGRTDSGVHGLGMVAHIDVPKAFPADTIRDGLNAHLRPAPIAILRAQAVTADFHARFSCFARHYEYRILNRRPPPTLEHNQVWPMGPPLDVAAMDQAAQCLVGKHDFTTFRSVQCQAESPIKTLSTIAVTREADRVIVRISAPSFLHNQVRSIVGSLAQIGMGRWPQAGLKAALDAKNRARCGPVAPAAGLYFVKADYPPALLGASADPDAPQAG